MRAHETARAVLFAGVLSVFATEAADASPPANDSFADATVIAELPYTDTQSLTESTTEPGEPQFCGFVTQSVWYVYRPTSTVIVRAEAVGSGSVTVYRSFGGDIGSLGFMGCPGTTILTAEAGVTYYFRLGGFFSGGPATLKLTEIVPPAHDDFADARAVDALPYADSFDFMAATMEAGEPSSPGGSAHIEASVWYAYTAAGPESVTASIAPFCCTYSVMAVYTGDSVGRLTLVAARFGSQVTFGPVLPGGTYYIQVGRGASFGSPMPMTFRVDLTPPPVVSFGVWPPDPSTFDQAQFNDTSQDPAQVGIASQHWDLGDGTTAEGCCPTHRFATDADYSVTLTVTTPDGRTASAAQVVPVRTHDVAIMRFAVPSSASPGQTRAITVGVNNTRYPDAVQVQLFKSVPSGLELVGFLSHLVPVVSRNREVPFDFSYTFTEEDAVIGKVTFQAVATIVNARDAQPADNTAIAFPTRVRD